MGRKYRNRRPLSKTQARKFFEEELKSGEQLLWTGEPDLTVRFNTSDHFIVPLFAIVGGIFFLAGGKDLLAAFVNANLSMLTNGVPLAAAFTLIGGAVVYYALFGRVQIRAAVKRRWYYALTGKRALILRDKAQPEIQSILLNQLPAIRKDVRINGIGTIFLGDFEWFTVPKNRKQSSQVTISLGSGAMLANRGVRVLSPETDPSFPVFMDIANAGEVYSMIEKHRALA